MTEDSGPTRGPSRRAVLGLTAGCALLGTAATAVGVNESVLPGRSWILGRIGLNGPAGTPPGVAAGPRVDGSLASAARLGADCGWSVGYPPGVEPEDRPALPVVLVLHGRGADHTAAFADTYLALGRYQAAAIGGGAPPFAYASIDGGDTYWHPRATGEDAAAMVTQEFLPLLAERGLDVTRIGLLGWSMGGFGALRLAGRLGPARVAAVVAESPALWHRYEDSSRGAFDDAEDFEAETVFGRQDELSGIDVRVDCGQSDPFYAATRDYVEGFAARPAGGFQLGAHDTGYWRRMAPAQTVFLAGSLAQA